MGLQELHVPAGMVGQLFITRYRSAGSYVEES